MYITTCPLRTPFSPASGVILLTFALLLGSMIAGCNKDASKNGSKKGSAGESSEQSSNEGPKDSENKSALADVNPGDSQGVTVKTTFDPKNPGQPSVTVNGKQLKWNTDAQAPPQDDLFVVRGEKGQRIPIKAGVVSKDLMGYRLALQNQPRGCSGVGLIPDDLVRFSLILKKSLTPEGLSWQVTGYRNSGKSSGMKEEVKGVTRNIELTEDGMSGELFNVIVPGKTYEETLLIDGRFDALYCEHNMNKEPDDAEEIEPVEGDLTMVIAGEDFPVKGAIARMLGGRPMITLSSDPLSCKTVMGRDADVRLKLTPGIREEIGQAALSGDLIPFGSMPHTQPGESGLEWTLGEPANTASGQQTMRVELSGGSKIGEFTLNLKGTGVDALVCDSP